MTGRPVMAALIVVLLCAVGIMGALPVQDGDLFWHLAYARQMIERGTLVLDHTAFSWTPTSNETIYCAWLAELLLYGVWQIGRLAGIAIVRYAVLASVVVLAWRFARRLGLADRAATYLLLLVLALGSSAGVGAKPELFSLLLMQYLVAAVFAAKQAARDGRPARRFLWTVPLIVLVWANTHGAFVLAAPFLALTAIGEGVMRWSKSPKALSAEDYHHLLAAWLVAGLAVVVTPYGIAYPLQLFSDYVLGGAPRPDVAWNAAYQRVWSASGFAMHLPEYLALGLVALSVLCVRAIRARGAAGVDWTVVLTNLVYAGLFVVYLRTTFFWPAVCAYSVLWLWSSDPGVAHTAARSATGRFASLTRLAALEGVVFAMLFLGARAYADARDRPITGSWLGFGISYINPVPEAEFLSQALLGPRLYNIFDSGGYLLWRLGPAYRVMVDSRSFPYLNWFDEQYAFTTGTLFEPFLEKYRGDVAIIDLAKADTWRNFLRAPEWQLAYYGPTAAVFVPRSVALSGLPTGVAPTRFADIRNATTAVAVLEFASSIGDAPTARTMFGLLDGPLQRQVRDQARSRIQRLRQANVTR